MLDILAKYSHTIEMGVPLQQVKLIADEIAPVPPVARQVTDEEMAWLSSLLAGISDDQIDVTNHKAFVDQVNRILRASRQRIKLPDGRLALLRWGQGMKQNYSYIQFGVSGGSFGRLGKIRPILLVPVPGRKKRASNKIEPPIENC